MLLLTASVAMLKTCTAASLCCFMKHGLKHAAIEAVSTHLTTIGIHCLELLQEVISFGSPNDLVIDISDIHDIQYAVAKVIFQNSPDYVEGDIVACMPHVGTVVHCRSTFIPGQLPTTESSCRHQCRLAVCQAIIYLRDWDC